MAATERPPHDRRTANPARAVVFDVGGVVLDWDPRHLYRRIFDGDEAAVGHFLTTVCTWEWHMDHDRGRPMAETIPEVVARHPHLEAEIRAWQERYVEMVDAPIAGTVEVVAELGDLGVPRYVLSNMPAEVMAPLTEAFEVLATFDGHVISGMEGVAKPDPAIFALVVERFGVDPADTVFVDDRDENVAAAAALGFRTVHFTSPAALRTRLRAEGLALSPEAVVSGDVSGR